MAVTEDFTGDEIYTIRVIDIATGQLVAKKITNVTSQIEWLKDNETLIYVTQDEVHRPYKVCYAHRLSYSLIIEAWLEAACVLFRSDLKGSYSRFYTYCPCLPVQFLIRVF